MKVPILQRLVRVGVSFHEWLAEQIQSECLQLHPSCNHVAVTMMRNLDQSVKIFRSSICFTYTEVTWYLGMMSTGLGSPCCTALTLTAPDRRYDSWVTDPHPWILICKTVGVFRWLLPSNFEYLMVDFDNLKALLLEPVKLDMFDLSP